MHRLMSVVAIVGLAACGDDPLTNPPIDARLDDAIPAIDAVDAAGAPSWTWREVPTSRCGNGTPTGLGLNVLPGARSLVVLIEGGGACWNALSCFGAPALGVSPLAANLRVTYDGTYFASTWQAAIESTGLTDRGAGGPFADASFAAIPYCTGDLHAGDNRYVYDIDTQFVEQRGSVNIGADLDVLRAQFPDVETVYVVGISAGGYGAQLNFDRFVAAFPAAEVHLLADCAPMVQPLAIDPLQASYPVWKDRWQLRVVPGCPTCATDFEALPDYLAARFPSSRQGLLVYDSDDVIAKFFGYRYVLGNDNVSFTAKINAFLPLHYTRANARWFRLAGMTHVMLSGYHTLAQPGGGLTLAEWVRRWAVGDAAWTSAP